MGNAHALRSAHFTLEYVNEVRARGNGFRLRVRQLENLAVRQAIELELWRAGRDPKLVGSVIDAGVSINDDGVVIGADLAVRALV